MHVKLVSVLLVFVFACPIQANDLSGRWRGTWTTFSQGQKRPHHGTLHITLRAEDPGVYRGTFSGRFAVIVPYFYRATVYQHGNLLTSTKRLGPFGDYRMQLTHQPGALNGTWSAGGEAGEIRLQAR
jgi:hypothetical protein